MNPLVTFIQRAENLSIPEEDIRANDLWPGWHTILKTMRMKIACAFKYELYVDEPRRMALSRNAGHRWFVFNKATGIQNERKEKGEKLLTYNELAHELMRRKKQHETTVLREGL